MAVPKIKLIVSDFHLGRGRYLPNGDRNPLEDFNHDNRFQEWLDYYSQPPYEDSEIEIVFNGDMLNLIQVDYHGHFPVVISETVSIERTKAVIKGHPVFFKSLKRFLAKPGKSMTYIIGNHDQEMMWKKTREIFEEAV